MNWLRTVGGVEFLVAGDRFVFVEQRADTEEWRVVHCRREGELDRRYLGGGDPHWYSTLAAEVEGNGDPYWFAKLAAETWAQTYAATAPAPLLDDATAIAQASARLDGPTATEESPTA